MGETQNLETLPEILRKYLERWTQFGVIMKAGTRIKYRLWKKATNMKTWNMKLRNIDENTDENIDLKIQVLYRLGNTYKWYIRSRFIWRNHTLTSKKLSKCYFLNDML